MSAGVRQALGDQREHLGLARGQAVEQLARRLGGRDGERGDDAGPRASPGRRCALTFLPLVFISGIWYPLDGAPDWMTTIAHVFPLYHLVDAFDACFVPQTSGGGWAPHHLAVLAVWAVGAMVVAVRRFRAEPEPGRQRARLA